MPNQLEQTLNQLLDQEQWVQIAGLAWRYFDIGSSIIWATTGALRAAKRGYDLSGLFAIALVSSTGGGLLRDALFLQIGPPALVRTPVYIAIAGTASVVVWLCVHKVPRVSGFGRIAGWADALGLGGFAVVGMQLATALNLSLLGVLLIGIVNTTGGGLLRSLLMHEVPSVFRPGHFTAVAALAGCVLYEVLTVGCGVDGHYAAIPTVLLVASIRRLSIRFRVRTRPPLGYRERPARRFASPARPREPRSPHDSNQRVQGRSDG